jgi:hypothetical protein
MSPALRIREHSIEVGPQFIGEPLRQMSGQDLGVVLLIGLFREVPAAGLRKFASY